MAPLDGNTTSQLVARTRTFYQIIEEKVKADEGLPLVYDWEVVSVVCTNKITSFEGHEAK